MTREVVPEEKLIMNSVQVTTNLPKRSMDTWGLVWSTPVKAGPETWIAGPNLLPNALNRWAQMTPVTGMTLVLWLLQTATERPAAGPLVETELALSESLLFVRGGRLVLTRLSTPNDSRVRSSRRSRVGRR